MAKLKGIVRDAQSGAEVAAKVRVLSSGGRFVHPAAALLKVGPGDPSFYCPGTFEVDVPGGVTDIIVERGTEYEPLRHTITMPSKGALEIDLELERWADLPGRGWYPGNTHIHYNETEGRPDERLRLDPQVHDLSVTVVSILQRGQIPYASNQFPVGFMTDFSTAHHQVDCGEESRHNARHGGYGHIMFLHLRNLVEPVSRGDLVSAFDPDYPPLCFACDDARRQGGLVLWCHNGNGMEAPVAAGLGKLDAFNLFDPCWKDLEYDIWYQLLNCGISLPASTGSDWFICSNNRVYVQTEGAFNYESWLAGLQAGRTFITNGPALFLDIDGVGPGGRLDLGPRGQVAVEWQSHYPLTRIELVQDGEVVGQRSLEGGQARQGCWELDAALCRDGWIAARAWGAARDSFAQPVYAHTSPVLVGTGRPAHRVGEAAGAFARSIEASSRTIGRYNRFTTDAQRSEVLHLFEEGRKVYAGLAAG